MELTFEQRSIFIIILDNANDSRAGRGGGNTPPQTMNNFRAITAVMLWRVTDLLGFRGGLSQ